MWLARAVRALEFAGPPHPVSAESADAATVRGTPERRKGRRHLLRWAVAVGAGVAALAAGFVTAPRPYAPFPRGTLAPQFRSYWDTEPSSVEQIYSDTTIKDDSVYAYVNVYGGDDDSRLYAFDASTGHIRWTLSWGEDVPFGPFIAVAAGNIYVVEGDGIYALSAASGHRLWVHKTGNADVSDLVVGGTSLYFTVSANDNAGDVYALNTADGITRWARKGIIPNEPADDHNLAFADRTVYVLDDPGTLYALDSSNGSIRWTAKHFFTSSPVVSGNSIYITGEGHLYALDTATGRILWTYPGISATTDLDPTVSDGTVYFGATHVTDSGGTPNLSGGWLDAISATTGKLRWTYRVTKDDDPESGVMSLASDRGIVFAGATDGAEYAIRKRTARCYGATIITTSQLA